MKHVILGKFENANFYAGYFCYFLQAFNAFFYKCLTKISLSLALNLHINKTFNICGPTILGVFLPKPPKLDDE